MIIASLIQLPIHAGRRLFGRFSASVTLFPTLVRKPAVAFWCLIGARTAQIALVALLLLMVFAFPRVRDSFLAKRYPPVTVTKKKLLGLVKTTTTHEDTRLQSERRRLTLTAWFVSGGFVILLLWLHIPPGVTRASLLAKERERDADEKLAVRPSESLVLYRVAYSLACDAEQQASLQSKIDDLAQQLSQSVDMEPLGHATRGRSGDADSSTDERGRVADRYLIGQELGRGAMGIVYRAHDVVLEREVAIKKLPLRSLAGGNTVPRFRQEARALAKLSHPNIVQVYDFVEANGELWMAIELVGGGDLSRYLAEQGRLPVSEVASLGVQMAGALAVAHKRGVIHRDLKPQNILLTRDGTPKISDFGLARLATSTVDTIEGTILGSPLYMSPEQADGKSADAGSDVYSLGVMLYEMLTGHVPFDGETASVVLVQHITKRPQTFKKMCVDVKIPRKVEKLVRQMLAKKPDDRTPDMSAVVHALAPFAKELGVSQR